MRWRIVRIAALVVLLLLIGVHLWNCWYPSGAVVAFKHSTLDEVRERTEPVLGPYDLDEYGLPQPEDVFVEAGNDVVLSGWFFEYELDQDHGVVLLDGRGDARVETLPYVPRSNLGSIAL